MMRGHARASFFSPRAALMANLLRRFRRRFGSASGLTLRPPSGGRPDVLVHPEKVGRVVFLLQRTQALVVVAIGRLEPCVALIVHHEIRVGTAEIEGMHRLPICLGPARYRSRFLRVRI